MKTKILIGFCVLALAVAGFFVAQEYRARSWESRWNAFLTHWQAEGEVFDPAKLIPPDLGEDRDFARHPWIRRIVDGDAALLQTLEKMDPDSLDGYEDWVSDADDSGVHPPMPPELARRIEKHAAEFSAELEAFAEAARRPGCRLVADGRASTGEMAWNTSASLLFVVGKLLGASAHAAAVLGDSPSLTHDLETLHLAGNLLRSSNLTLGVVVGSGFEARAYDVERSIPDLTSWPERDRRRWLAALDLRTRPLADEFAATSRMERAFYLKLIDGMEADRSAPLAKGLAGYGPFRRMYLARARLAACEALQGMVLSDGGHLSAQIDPARITRFQVYLKNKNQRDSRSSSKSYLHPAEAFGLLPQFVVLGVHDALIWPEEERARARERISSSLR